MAKHSRLRSPATLWLGIAFLLIGLSLAYVLVAYWPRTEIAPATQRAVTAGPAPAGGGREVDIVVEKKSWSKETRVAGVKFDLDADTRLLILVLLAGALGGYVHAAQSFASYVGNASFKPSWTWWYILRLPMGAFLSVFVYFAIRGGLLAAGTATGAGAANELNLFGIMSFSGLAGLFSKQAADKLAEVFDTLFATKEDRKREDKLGENPRPVIERVSLETLPSGDKAIAVTGHGFVQRSVVRAAGKDLATIFRSAQSLVAQVPASGLGKGPEVEVSVFNPEPGGGASEMVSLKVAEPGPAPSDGGQTASPLAAAAGNGGGASAGSGGAGAA